MPFAGTVGEARAALGSLTALRLGDYDELILADNCGTALGLGQVRPGQSAPARVIDARGERSPAHARNAGAAAAAAGTQWILFLDADTLASSDLPDHYFAEPIADDVGAVAGGIAAAPGGPSAGIAARYGAYKNFLDAGAHLAHPFMPRAAAANLLVRRAAFDAVGGFFEGLRAAEDTDFSWRLQRAGWTLEGRPGAAVQHRYRDSLRDLRRQWRGYAAGRAWLGRRYDGFAPQPALLRVGRTTWGAPGRASDLGTAPPPSSHARREDDDRQAQASSQSSGVDVRDRARFAALDVILGVEELIGFALSNRPAGAPTPALTSGRVLVADQFPIGQTDPAAGAASASPHAAVAGADAAEAGADAAARGADAAAGGADAAAGAASLSPVRIEAGRRADHAARPRSDVTIIYREDDGPLYRALALTTLVARSPGRVLTVIALDRDAPSPSALAPAACRLLAEPAVTLAPLSCDPLVRAATRRLGQLASREPVECSPCAGKP
jgi:hypothetical protein